MTLFLIFLIFVIFLVLIGRSSISGRRRGRNYRGTAWPDQNSDVSIVSTNSHLLNNISDTASSYTDNTSYSDNNYAGNYAANSNLAGIDSDVDSGNIDYGSSWDSGNGVDTGGGSDFGGFGGGGDFDGGGAGGDWSSSSDS